MDTFIQLVVFFAFVLSIIAVISAVAIWVQNTNLQKSWLARVGELDAATKQVEEKQDLLRLTLEKVHKLHLERQEDLAPLLDRIIALEVRSSALAANIRRPG